MATDPSLRPPPHASGERPWLSVLVPAYNVARYVEAMLRSVLVQGSEDIEILVVDDASTDGTAGIVDRIAQGRRHVRVIRHARNVGVAATRNELLDNAAGEYVWFVDADDIMARGAILAARAALEDRQPDILTCDFRTLDGPLWQRRRRRTFAGASRGTGAEDLLAGALQAGQLHVWSRLARRDLWTGVRFPSRKRFEDMTAVAALLSRAGQWRHVPEAWIAYRQRAGSLSRGVPLEGLHEYAQALGEVGAIAELYHTGHHLKQARDYYLLRGHASIARRLAQSRCPPGFPVARACRARFMEDFPRGPEGALAECRQRGWWLRALRIEHALVRAGWA